MPVCLSGCEVICIKDVNLIIKEINMFGRGVDAHLNILLSYWRNVDCIFKKCL